MSSSAACFVGSDAELYAAASGQHLTTTSIAASGSGVSLRDALINVSALDELPVVDDQPVIEANCPTLECRTSLDTGFQDSRAFVLGSHKYIEEATRHAQFLQAEMLDKGFTHAANLYTWRCCSRAVPMPKSNDQPNRAEINERIVQVLAPEVQKLDAFMQFTMDAVTRFCEEFRRLSHPEMRKDYVSEAYLIVLGRLMNMFVVLDALKDMKASIKNDLSTFHRASQVPSHTLILFLATQNRIKQILREELRKIEGYEELLSEIININVHFYENGMFLSPDQKHTHIKVIAFCLYLLDADVYHKLDQKKRLSIAKLDKIFKSVEVVPLFGDMNVLPFSFVKQCRNPSEGPCATGAGNCRCFDSAKWPLSSSESENCHVNLVKNLNTIRSHHNDYVTHLARIRNELSVYDQDGPRSDAENAEIAKLALSGLQLLGAWSSDVVETIAWKLLNPTNHRKNSECPEGAETYELATKYNYTAEERAALIELISMIKGVQQLMGKMRGEFAAAIRNHIYAELQDFVKHTLREPLNKAIKHKKDMLSGVITSIIDMASDGVVPGSDAISSTTFDKLSKCHSRSSDLASMKSSSGAKDASALKKAKGKKAVGGSSSVVGSIDDLTTAPKRRRCVAPSSTQLYLVRTMLESLLSERSASTGKRILRKDIDPKHLEKMIKFLRVSYYWPGLLDFGRALDECADLSQLWFREFYLEMSMGTRIQFPIDMSLPWILIDHILTSMDPALQECLLYQLDLYNDAANYALRRFQKQFLYDEIEAEVNLCFDQFVFKFSEAVFTHYKQLAAYMLLDKGFRTECARLGITIRSPPAARFRTLVEQRHVQLLGRSIDLNRLVSQRVNAALLRSLEVAITRFEAEPLAHIIMLDQLLEVNRLCHQLLSEQQLSLSDFADLLAEANRQVAASANGRITLHVFSELAQDVIPNYCFNSTTQRFVRGKMQSRAIPERPKGPTVTFTYEFGSKSLNLAFSNLSAMYHGFIGVQHLRAVVRLIGYQGMAAILNDLLVLARRIINDPLKTHTRVLLGLAPRQCKLPRYDYKVVGVLQYYIHHNREFLSYTPLKREFGQALRELGNIICFVYQLEMANTQEEMQDLHMSAPFHGGLPKPPATSQDETYAKLQRLEAKYAHIQITDLAQQQLRFETHLQIARDNELLTRERLCCGLSIFEMVLSKLQEVLNADPIWRGPEPDNGVMWVDECVEWHRIWSGFLFAYCFCLAQQAHVGASTPSAQGHNSGSDTNEPIGIEQVFGDGVHWAGLAIIRLLQQHRRFEVLDYSAHVLRVHKTVGSGGSAGSTTQATTTTGKEKGGKQKDAGDEDGTKTLGVPTLLLLDQIRRQLAFNAQILAALGTHMVAADERHARDQAGRYIAPPVYQRGSYRLEMAADTTGSAASAEHR